MVHDLVTVVAAVTVAARLNAISLHMSDESTYTMKKRYILKIKLGTCKENNYCVVHCLFHK